jgi:hypothetical protein
MDANAILSRLVLSQTRESKKFINFAMRHAHTHVVLHLLKHGGCGVSGTEGLLAKVVAT